jgi:hypothetical protein
MLVMQHSVALLSLFLQSAVKADQWRSQLNILFYRVHGKRMKMHQMMKSLEQRVLPWILLNSLHSRVRSVVGDQDSIDLLKKHLSGGTKERGVLCKVIWRCRR